MADRPPIELTRQELYDRVWETPMRTLAAQWGISDVGLAKICKKHSIPRPGIGHWAKLQFGHTVSKAPLPPIKKQQQSTIVVSPYAGDAPDDVADPQIAKLILDERLPDNAVIVRKRAQLNHPVLKATQESLSGAGPGFHGRTSGRRTRAACFDVNVAPKNVPRVLRILRALTSAMQSRGYELKSDKGIGLEGEVLAAYFEVFGERCEIAIRELSKQTILGDDGYGYKRRIYTPTGLLVLHVNHSSYRSDAVVRDTKRKPLESRLNEVIASMLRIADRKRKEAEDKRREEKRKAKRKKAALEREIERRSDSVRAKRLIKLTRSWHRFTRIKTLIDAMRTVMASHETVKPGTARLLKWADDFLKTIDPFAVDLPEYDLTKKESRQLRRECEEDWSDYSETFRKQY